MSSDRRQATVLAIVLAVQTLASMFFVADVASDLHWGGLTLHSGLEALVACSLVLGTAFGALQMRLILQRIRFAEIGIAAASGAFFELIEARFRDWQLTPAETEIALLTLKGLNVTDIASIRGSAESTVRAQLAKVYSKADVSSRGQFTSLFIEELLASPLSERP